MLDGIAELNCRGNALVRSLAAGGANVQSGTGAQHSGSQVIYAGMAGLLDGGGGVVGGHVFSTQTANLANGNTKWADLALSPVANESLYNGVFNPYFFDVSSLYVDPHDATGKTVYATIQGFGVPHLYMSTDGGADWNNISKNLPDLPLNSVLVDRCLCRFGRRCICNSECGKLRVDRRTVLEYFGSRFADGACGDSFRNPGRWRPPPRGHLRPGYMASSPTKRRAANVDDSQPDNPHI
jgi:hypothetical protein